MIGRMPVRGIHIDATVPGITHEKSAVSIHYQAGGVVHFAWSPTSSRDDGQESASSVVLPERPARLRNVDVARAVDREGIDRLERVFRWSLALTDTEDLA